MLFLEATFLKATPAWDLIQNNGYMDYPPFLQENLDPLIYDFSKISTPLKVGGVHTMHMYD